ncbi:hypothetical protein C8R45DRAFT_1022668 [Mycena sanguinolenta]|nr:hypothetical protein C8R45DRAFT_1022668 [Mycena sanguinolenta]
MTTPLQLWLGLRLDIFGNILVFGIALFAAAFRHTVDPSKIGVVTKHSQWMVYEMYYSWCSDPVSEA